MFKNCNEEDFYGLRLIGEEGLDVKKILKLFRMTLVLGIFITFFIVCVVSTDTRINYRVWKSVARFDVIFMVFETSIVAFFKIFKKNT